MRLVDDFSRELLSTSCLSSSRKLEERKGALANLLLNPLDERITTFSQLRFGSGFLSSDYVQSSKELKSEALAIGKVLKGSSNGILQRLVNYVHRLSVKFFNLGTASYVSKVQEQLMRVRRDALSSYENRIALSRPMIQEPARKTSCGSLDAVFEREGTLGSLADLFVPSGIKTTDELEALLGSRRKSEESPPQSPLYRLTLVRPVPEFKGLESCEFSRGGKAPKLDLPENLFLSA